MRLTSVQLERILDISSWVRVIYTWVFFKRVSRKPEIVLWLFAYWLMVWGGAWNYIVNYFCQCVSFKVNYSLSYTVSWRVSSALPQLQNIVGTALHETSKTSVSFPPPWVPVIQAAFSKTVGTVLHEMSKTSVTFPPSCPRQLHPSVAPFICVSPPTFSTTATMLRQVIMA